jgi:hypothetical protein
MAQIAIQKAEVFGRWDSTPPWLGPAMKERCEEDLSMKFSLSTIFEIT